MLFEDYRLTGRSAVLPVCPFFIGLKNPNKGCKHLTQRRKGVEKARKENLFKKRE
jgi:hypothetical protein